MVGWERKKAWNREQTDGERRWMKMTAVHQYPCSFSWLRLWFFVDAIALDDACTIYECFKLYTISMFSCTIILWYNFNVNRNISSSDIALFHHLCFPCIVLMFHHVVYVVRRVNNGEKKNIVRKRAHYRVNSHHMNWKKLRWELKQIHVYQLRALPIVIIYTYYDHHHHQQRR